MAHTTARAARNPKAARFTSIHESVTSAPAGAPLQRAGYRTVGVEVPVFGLPPCSSNGLPSSFQPENGAARLGILARREYFLGLIGICLYLVGPDGWMDGVSATCQAWEAERRERGWGREAALSESADLGGC